MKRYLTLLAGILMLGQVFAINNNISKHDVVWNTPSKNASGTMPIGNGDIAASVYAIENDALYLLLAKNDAFTYQGDIFKTGRLKITFSSNPFKSGAKFKQTLNLQEGVINIEADGININIWADANAPVYHVDIDSKQDITVTAQADLWARFDRCQKNQIREIKDLEVVQDVVEAKDDQITWYYHVGDFSVFEDDMRHYDVEHMINQFEDPYRFNTFGNLVEAQGMTLEGDVLKGKGKTFSILTHALTEQVKEPSQWVDDIKAQAAEYVNNDDTWHNHQGWWSDFWSRSWIMASNNTIPKSKREVFNGEADENGVRTEADNAAIISQSHNMFRYIMACQSRGKIQAKFNGGLFTQQLLVAPKDRMVRSGEFTQVAEGKLSHPDDRFWGRRFTWQNQRLLYWPLLATGDFDLMQPFYNYYDKILPMRKAITMAWFGHEGAYFRENICPTGSERDNQLASGTMPSGTKPSKAGVGATAKYFHEFYFYSSLELVIMLLEYSDYTEDPYFTEKYVIPMAREVLTFFDRHYDRDANGKLLIDPSQVLETFWRAKNPTPEVASLQYCLEALEKKNLGTEKDKRNWRRLLSELPALAMQTTPDGKQALAPAEEYSYTKNTENGELYAVFPATLFGVAHGNEDIVTNTMAVRTVVDGRYNCCWTQDQIDWAYAGNAAEAARGLETRFRVASTQLRFPLFAREIPDSCPDLDHFGSGSIALQRMLIQEADEKIVLFPAWPASWDVNFKLHAHYNTTIEGEVKNGKVVSWKVTPEWRAKDITVNPLQ